MGARGNYISVPTDCPQRDERLGWMGDCRSVHPHCDLQCGRCGVFTKWLVDVDDSQTPEGSFSDVSPNTMKWDGVPAWGDAGVICPWTIYEVYGDKRILEQHLSAMIKWVDICASISTDLIRDKDRGNDYGDWLSIGADTPKDLIGTAYFAYLATDGSNRRSRPYRSDPWAYPRRWRASRHSRCPVFIRMRSVLWTPILHPLDHRGQMLFQDPFVSIDS